MLYEVITIYNLINVKHKLISFVPEGGGYHWTDPSYNVPAFFEIIIANRPLVRSALELIVDIAFLKGNLRQKIAFPEPILAFELHFPDDWLFRHGKLQKNRIAVLVSRKGKRRYVVEVFQGIQLLQDFPIHIIIEVLAVVGGKNT